jgi:uncharacterized protein YjiS (DUF1127 family)
MNSALCPTSAEIRAPERRVATPIGLAMLMIWLRRSRTRRQLCCLDARELLDIGRSEAERQRECARWFWQGSDGAAP